MAKMMRFHYCPHCSAPLTTTFAYGLERLVCTACGKILYENPIVGVAAIIINSMGQILLVRRSAESTMPGLWCIPCGYVEYDEDVWDAVVREAKEETGLTVKPLSVYTVRSNFHDSNQHTVGIWFRTEVLSGTVEAGDDAVETMWADLNNLPPLAFPTDREVLRGLRNEE